MKRVDRWSSALEKRMLQRASRYYAWVESLGRCESNAKEGMVMLFVRREMAPSYRLHSRKVWYVYLDLFYEQRC